MNESLPFSQVPLHSGALLLGRFRIMNRLGSGANAVVYRALDTDLENRQVALKCVSLDVSASGAVIERLYREVLLTRRLNHKHIVSVHELLCADTRNPVVVMEIVDGGTLAMLIQSGESQRLPIAERLELLRQIVSALAYAHSAGIVHRDIKPENILLTLDGDAKIADFGLGRCFKDDQRLTATGASLGTPYYMSPEQFRGEDAGPAADIYSFGILAYELLTGSKPFTDDVYFALALKHVLNPLPKPASWDPELPDWLFPLLTKCTEKRIEDRFSSMEDVVSLLEKTQPSASGGARLQAVARIHRGARRAKVKSRALHLLQCAGLGLAIFLSLQVFALLLAQFSNNMRLRTAAVALQAEGWFGSTAMFPIKRALGVQHLRLDRPEDMFPIIEADQSDSNRLNVLVWAGADLTIRDANGDTPLFRTAGKFTGSFRIMVEHGADINERGTGGLSAFQKLMAAGLATKEILDRFLGQVDLTIKDDSGMNILHHAVTAGVAHAVRSILADRRSIGILHERDQRGLSPLELAASLEIPFEAEVVEALIAGGADPSQPRSDGQNALHLAISNRRIKAATVIAQRSAPQLLAAKNGSGQTPLALLQSLNNPSAEELRLVEWLSNRR